MHEVGTTIRNINITVKYAQNIVHAHKATKHVHCKTSWGIHDGSLSTGKQAMRSLGFSCCQIVRWDLPSLHLLRALQQMGLQQYTESAMLA